MKEGAQVRAPYRFKCECGSSVCRGYVTDEDWKVPPIQKKFEGFFSELPGGLIWSLRKD